MGSSDRHDGISGYNTGMLAVLAKEPSHDAVIDALRARRTYALRGGEPITLDFLVNGTFQGGETEAGGAAPKISVEVAARSVIEKIEIASNGKFVYSYAPEAEASSATFTYRDSSGPVPGTYYYARVWLKGRSRESGYQRQEFGKYAWSSPVWLK